MVSSEGETAQPLKTEGTPPPLEPPGAMTETMQQAMAAALAVQQFALQEGQGSEPSTGQHSRTLVADLCKIIERQSQEIANLVQGRQPNSAEARSEPPSASTSKKPNQAAGPAGKPTVATVLAVKSNETDEGVDAVVCPHPIHPPPPLLPTPVGMPPQG